MELVGEENIKYCMVEYRECGMECIIGEDFNMEYGIYLEGEKYFFTGWVLEETVGDSLRAKELIIPFVVERVE